MQTNNKQKSDLSHASLGVRIWINCCWAVINTAVLIFLVVTRLIIIILFPFVLLSLFIENLNLKLRKAILEKNLKSPSDKESNSKV